MTGADVKPNVRTDDAGPGGPQLPEWLRTAGLASWLILGIAGAVALGAVVFAFTRSLSIPLLVAIILGAIFVPIVDGLHGLRVPRWLGSLIVMALVLALTALILFLVVSGVVERADEIGAEIQAGIERIEEGLARLGLAEGMPSRIKEQVEASPSVVSGGVLALVRGSLSSATAFLVGLFLAVNILFFVLKDAHQISAWLAARSSGVVATTLLSDSSRALRAYFQGKALVGAASGVTVFLGALILGVPLPFSIGLVTFFTSFIPYIGAIIAGAFAVLLALGSGGLSSALAILAVVVIANAVVESLLSPFTIGASLRLHPLVVLVVTILGGIVAGLVGVTLAAPATAIGVEIVARLRETGVFASPRPTAG